MHNKPGNEDITAEEVKCVIALYDKGGDQDPGAGVFRRELVERKLGKANISTFNVRNRCCTTVIFLPY